MDDYLSLLEQGQNIVFPLPEHLNSHLPPGQVHVAAKLPLLHSPPVAGEAEPHSGSDSSLQLSSRLGCVCGILRHVQR